MRSNPRISTNAFDYRLSQLVCFTGAPSVFLCGIIALQQCNAAPAEFVIGILAAGSLAQGMVALGFVGKPHPLIK